MTSQFAPLADVLVVAVRSGAPMSPAALEAAGDVVLNDNGRWAALALYCRPELPMHVAEKLWAMASQDQPHAWEAARALRPDGGVPTATAEDVGALPPRTALALTSVVAHTAHVPDQLLIHLMQHPHAKVRAEAAVVGSKRSCVPECNPGAFTGAGQHADACPRAAALAVVDAVGATALAWFGTGFDVAPNGRDEHLLIEAAGVLLGWDGMRELRERAATTWVVPLLLKKIVARDLSLAAARHLCDAYVLPALGAESASKKSSARLATLTADVLASADMALARDLAAAWKATPARWGHLTTPARQRISSALDDFGLSVHEPTHTVAGCVLPSSQGALLDLFELIDSHASAAVWAGVAVAAGGNCGAVTWEELTAAVAAAQHD